MENPVLVGQEPPTTFISQPSASTRPARKLPALSMSPNNRIHHIASFEHSTDARKQASYCEFSDTANDEYPFPHCTTIHFSLYIILSYFIFVAHVPGT